MARGQRAPERFLTTVLMTDIVGSTEHASELGDSSWRELVQLHHTTVRAALRRHNGREIDTAGDGFFATFDAPAAAVACALDVVGAVKELGIDIRAGVHVGEVEQVGPKVGGITVPIASRIMSLADPGEVLVSATVRDLATGSGLRFEDRGVRELKGVAGEWHVFAVARSVEAAAVSGPRTETTDAASRRAAVVQRARSRPIWQRRPRLVAGVAIGGALILVASTLAVWQPWLPPALGGVAEGSIGVIDVRRSAVVGEIGNVGAQPGGIAVGEGYVWVADTASDSLRKIDPAANAVVDTIEVGNAPTGVAVGAGSIWVANGGARTVSRINAATGRVVDTVTVGNGPAGVAVASGKAWVANAVDSTVVSIDPESGDAVGQPIGVPGRPIALVADDKDVWVASSDGAAVTRIDPGRGTGVASLQLPARPAALALDQDSVWVAAEDGTVTRIDREQNKVTATVDIGDSLSSIAVVGDTVWVGDTRGDVYRLDRADPSRPRQTIATLRPPEALAVVNGSVWVAVHQSVQSHRGGTLTIVDPYRFDTDPLFHSPPPEPGVDWENYTVTVLEADGLVGYRRVGGIVGSTLLPDLAKTVPQPTNGGKTYAFELRPGLVYSDGRPVRAGDFRRAIERSFQVEGRFGVTGKEWFSAIAGTEACQPVDDPADGSGVRPVETCDLSRGIVTDDAAGTVTFNLSSPDADLLYKLGTPAAYPVPEAGVPMHGNQDPQQDPARSKVNEGLVDAAFPGTGPYVVTSVSENELRLERNPRFRVWDPLVRPDGFPDEIVVHVMQPPEDDAARFEMVEKGQADFVSLSARGRYQPALYPAVRERYPGQWHVSFGDTYMVVLNTKVPPFDQQKVRQAVNYAINRKAIADLAGGPPDIAITCQILPPGWIGYQPYCPYTKSPGSGYWDAPDLEMARQLISQVPGALGTPIVVGPAPIFLNYELDPIKTALEDLGFVDVRVDKVDTIPEYTAARRAKLISVAPSGWSADWLSAGNFLSQFTCAEADGLLTPRYCDTAFDDAFKEALDLQTTDRTAAAEKWGELDRRATDLGLWVPLYNPGFVGFVAERVGNYQHRPAYGALFDQMWVQ